MFPLFRVPACPGGSGEPVLLLHGVAHSAQGFVYGSDNLATALASAGYEVFLATHRGDGEARGPGRVPATLDGVARIDLPAALASVRAATGASMVHVMGYGLGALLALDLGARCPDEVASVTALAPPLRVPAARTEMRAAQLALQLLPAHWSMPFRTLTRVALPLVEGEGCPGERLRGSMAYTTDDVPVAMVRQLLDWVDGGRPSLVEGVELEASLGRARAPLHVLVGASDTVALPASAAAAVAAWGGRATPHTVPGHGHLDLLYGHDVGEAVHERVITWLQPLRERSWGPFESVA